MHSDRGLGLRIAGGWAGLGLALICLAAPLGAAAEVFLSKNEALEQAFPGADEIRHRTIVLSDDQAEAVGKLAQSPIETRLATVHTATKAGAVMGHAFIDVHNVRTLPEAFLVVLDAEGKVVSTRILAFYEPQDYMPPDRWLEQFEDRSLDPSLSLKGNIHGIAGATLSSRAVTWGVRRSLALYSLFLADTAVVATTDTPPSLPPVSAGPVAAGGL